MACGIVKSAIASFIVRLVGVPEHGTLLASSAENGTNGHGGVTSGDETIANTVTTAVTTAIAAATVIRSAGRYPTMR